VLTAAASRGDIGNHSGFAVASEGVFEDLGKLASSEGQMLLFEV
jgi:hypothetical protein